MFWVPYWVSPPHKLVKFDNCNIKKNGSIVGDKHSKSKKRIQIEEKFL